MDSWILTGSERPALPERSGSLCCFSPHACVWAELEGPAADSQWNSASSEAGFHKNISFCLSHWSLLLLFLSIVLQKLLASYILVVFFCLFFLLLFCQSLFQAALMSCSCCEVALKAALAWQPLVLSSIHPSIFHYILSFAIFYHAVCF